MRVFSSPSFRDTGLPAGLILAALAAFAAFAFRVPGDLRLVSPEIDADLRRSPPPAALATPAAGAVRVEPGRLGKLVVRVTHVRNGNGKVSVAVHDRGPLDGGAVGVVGIQAVAASPQGSVVVFEGLPQGTYALTAFHDEDGDGRVAGKPGRPPSEGVGTSGSASPASGPPRWEDAQFAFDRDVLELEIPLYYF